MSTDDVSQLQEYESDVLVETYKSMTSLVAEGLKLLALVNGGGVIALLSLLGSYANKCTTLPDLTGPIMWLVAGLVCCMLALVAAYLAQMFIFKHLSENKSKERLRLHFFAFYAAVGLIALSVASFAMGAVSAAEAHAATPCI